MKSPSITTFCVWGLVATGLVIRWSGDVDASTNSYVLACVFLLIEGREVPR